LLVARRVAGVELTRIEKDGAAARAAEEVSLPEHPARELHAHLLEHGRAARRAGERWAHTVKICIDVLHLTTAATGFGVQRAADDLIEVEDGRKKPLVSSRYTLSQNWWIGWWIESLVG
jgi:hypothetical protein